MLYARIENNVIVEYPLFEGDIKLRFSNVSFSFPFVPPEGYISVEDVPYPRITYKQNVTEGEPQLINSKWTRVWIVTEATAEEVSARTSRKASDVLKIRDALLNSCNWTQLMDSPLSPVDKEIWAIYREDLRSVVNQPGYPWNVSWPESPSS